MRLVERHRVFRRTKMDHLGRVKHNFLYLPPAPSPPPAPPHPPPLPPPPNSTSYQHHQHHHQYHKHHQHHHLITAHLFCNHTILRSLLLLLLLLCISSTSTLFSAVTLVSGEQLLRPPRIKEHPTSLIVKKHEPAKLECKADGFPTPTIEWYRDGEKVAQTANRMFVTNSLVFLHVISKKGNAGDTGIYYCVARNEVGKAFSHNATLEVALLREEFRQMPANVRAAVGDSATLECAPPRGHPEPITWWTHEDRRIDATIGTEDGAQSGNRFKLAGHNLVIDPVTRQDQGKYRCVAQNILGTRESPPAILKVLEKPYFIRAPEDVVAMSDEDVVFHCKVGGDPAPTITWKREDGKMLHTRSQILDDRALRIAHVRPSDEGIYVCEVENSVGQISSSATLTVNSLPEIITAPKSVTTIAAKHATMQCLVAGNPAPLHFWSREGTPVLMLPGETYGKFTVAADGTLTISDVAKEDEGFYLCNAISRVGSMIARAYLTVSVPGDEPPPIIRLGAANQTLPQDTKAFLPCEAIGFARSPPKIRWFVGEREIRNDTDRYTITDRALQIQNIKPSDSGIYTCVAADDTSDNPHHHHRSTKWIARLAVESPRNPNINFHKMNDPSTFPEAPTKPAAINVTENSITLRWDRRAGTGLPGAFHNHHAHPHPHPHHLGSIVHYYSPDIRGDWIEAARRITADTVTISGLRPNTRYRFIVRAENKHGIGVPSSVSDEIRTLDPYQASSSGSRSPTIDNARGESQARSALSEAKIKLREARTVSSSSIKLAWSTVGNTDYIDGYYVRYRLLKRISSTTSSSSSSSSSQTIDNNNNNNNNDDQYKKFNMLTVFGNAPAATTTYIVADLRQFARYQFFVVPFYKNVEGRPSNSMLGRTAEDVPSGPPTDILVRAINETCASVRWSPPSPDASNGIIVAYQLEIRENHTLLYANLTLNSSYNSIVLHNLSSFSLYTIRAAAFTAIGAGPYSSPIYLNVRAALRDEFQLQQQQQQQEQQKSSNAIIDDNFQSKTIGDGHDPAMQSINSAPFTTNIWFQIFLLSIVGIIAILIFGLIKIVLLYTANGNGGASVVAGGRGGSGNGPKNKSNHLDGLDQSFKKSLIIGHQQQQQQLHQQQPLHHMHHLHLQNSDDFDHDDDRHLDHHYRHNRHAAAHHYLANNHNFATLGSVASSNSANNLYAEVSDPKVGSGGDGGDNPHENAHLLMHYAMTDLANSGGAGNDKVSSSNQSSSSCGSGSTSHIIGHSAQPHNLRSTFSTNNNNNNNHNNRLNLLDYHRSNNSSKISHENDNDNFDLSESLLLRTNGGGADGGRISNNLIYIPTKRSTNSRQHYAFDKSDDDDAEDDNDCDDYNMDGDDDDDMDKTLDRHHRFRDPIMSKMMMYNDGERNKPPHRSRQSQPQSHTSFPLPREASRTDNEYENAAEMMILDRIDRTPSSSSSSSNIDRNNQASKELLLFERNSQNSSSLKPAANMRDGPKGFARSSLSSARRGHVGSLSIAKYSIHPEPGRFSDYGNNRNANASAKQKLLTTFGTANIGAPATRVTVNPLVDLPNVSASQHCLPPPPPPLPMAAFDDSGSAAYSGSSNVDFSEFSNFNSETPTTTNNNSNNKRNNFNISDIRISSGPNSSTRSSNSSSINNSSLQRHNAVNAGQPQLQRKSSRSLRDQE